MFDLPKGRPCRAKRGRPSFTQRRCRDRRRRSFVPGVGFDIIDVSLVSPSWCSRFSWRSPVSAADLENTLYLDVPKGRVVIDLQPDLAPNTSRASRSWRARASMTASSSIASSTASWRRPAIPRRRHRRLGQEAQGRVQQRAASARHRLDGARGAPTAPTASSSSASRRRLPRRQIHDLRPGRLRHGTFDAIKKGDDDDNGAVKDPDRIVQHAGRGRRRKGEGIAFFTLRPSTARAFRTLRSG